MANFMDGPSLYFPKGSKRSATFKQIQDACVAAQAKLGDGYVLKLRNSRCGFQFIEWPNRRGHGFKVVDFFGLVGRWPRTEDGEVLETDSDVAETAGLQFGPWRRKRITTFLKSKGAPVFTRTEIDAIMSSFASCYDGCMITKMPSDAKLKKDFSKRKIRPEGRVYRKESV
jgi:hypothetical protein